MKILYVAFETPPYVGGGKKGDSDFRQGYYKINTREAKVARNIFSWVADEHLTLRGVVRRLKDLGILPRRSKRGVWSTSTLSTMLRNRTYIGEAHYGASYAVVPENPLNKDEYRKIKKTSRKIKPEEEWTIIKVPALITKDLFKRTRHQLENNFALCQRNKKNEYLVAGKIWCNCGCRRTGEGPQKGKHLYYRCTDRTKRFPLPKKCDEKGLNARIVDELIWRKIFKLMSSPELLIKQAERWKKARNNKTDSSTISVGATRKEITKLKKQEERYVKAYGAGAFSIEELKKYTAPIQNNILVLETQINKAQSESERMDIVAVPKTDELENFTKKVAPALKNLNFKAKKEIVENIVEKVVGNKKELQVYGYIPITKEYVEYFTNHRNRRTT